MDEQAFRGVPGVPEGWELVHANRTVKSGEYFLNSEGVPTQARADGESVYRWPVIRKIEEPAKYRPFANDEEFRPHRDRWVTRIGKSDSDAQPGACRVVAYDQHGVWFASGDYHFWQDAFEAGRCFDDDGTPFGVRLDD